MKNTPKYPESELLEKISNANSQRKNIIQRKKSNSDYYKNKDVYIWDSSWLFLSKWLRKHIRNLKNQARVVLNLTDDQIEEYFK